SASAEHPVPLTVLEEILAGSMPTQSLGRRQSAAIMTGAPLPPGADAVVMLERTQRDGDSAILIDAPVRAGQNRLVRGREMHGGEPAPARGPTRPPPRLGLLASVGRTQVQVLRRPRVFVVPTGDELVPPDQFPRPGQIRETNATTLVALAQAAGAS